MSSQQWAWAVSNEGKRCYQWGWAVVGVSSQQWAWTVSSESKRGVSSQQCQQWGWAVSSEGEQCQQWRWAVRALPPCWSTASRRTWASQGGWILHSCWPQSSVSPASPPQRWSHARPEACFTDWVNMITTNTLSCGKGDWEKRQENMSDHLAISNEGWIFKINSTANFISWLRKVKRCHVFILGSVLMTMILIAQDHRSPSLCTALMNSTTTVLCLHLNMSTVLTLPLASTESKVQRWGSMTPITDVPNRRCTPTPPVSPSSAVRSLQPLLARSWSAVASCSSACGRCARCYCAWWWCW